LLLCKSLFYNRLPPPRCEFGAKQQSTQYEEGGQHYVAEDVEEHVLCCVANLWVVEKLPTC